MKKSLFTMLFITAFSIAVMSQGLQPKFGINFSSVTMNSDMDDHKVALPGIHFGLAFSSGEVIGFQSEILYTQKGAKIEHDGSSHALKTNYLEIPLMLKVNIGPEFLKFFAVGGVYGAYWLSGTAESTYPNADDETNDYEFTDDYDEEGWKDNRLDYGLVFGAGAALQLGPGKLVAEVRYDFGLANTEKYKEEPEDYTPVKNRTLGISLGYAISF